MRPNLRPRRLGAWLFLATLAAFVRTPAEAPSAAKDAQVREIEEWRAKRSERLTSEDGWLTLVGLHWLKPGENRFGTGADNEIVLRPGSGPAHAGTFRLDAGRVRIAPAPGSKITLSGSPLTAERELKTDEAGAPDEIRSGRLRITVIKRGDRYALRAKDPMSPVRTGFRGLLYFPIQKEYRVDAEFVAYDRPKQVKVATVLGTTETYQAPGLVRFKIGAHDLSLEPVLEEPDAKQLFFIFRDRTSGKETYEAGRFLYTELPQDGKLTLDFNKAQNPPCAFTAYATCPLPPKQNWLDLAIEAGEKSYGPPHGRGTIKRSAAAAGATDRREGARSPRSGGTPEAPARPPAPGSSP